MGKKSYFGMGSRTELDERDTVFRRRSYYHKCFQGYTEIRRVNEKGRVTIERRYTAPWHRHQLTTAQWVLTKVAYVLGVLLSTVLFLWALMKPIPSNSAALCAAPGLFSGLMMILMWMAVCAYVTAPRKMTVWQYQSGKHKVELFTRLTAAGMIATVVAKVIYVCFWMHFSWTGEVVSLLALAAGVVPLILIFRAERRMSYEEIANATPVIEEEHYEIQ